MSRTVKINISNSLNKPLILSLEPWGEDYTLGIDEKVEIIAQDCSEDFYFHIVPHNDFMAVYAEGSGNDYPRVYSNGIELDGGYNRDLTSYFL
jgi:hypothetical protein